MTKFKISTLTILGICFVLSVIFIIYILWRGFAHNSQKKYIPKLSDLSPDSIPLATNVTVSVYNVGRKFTVSDDYSKLSCGNPNTNLIFYSTDLNTLVFLTCVKTGPLFRVNNILSVNYSLSGHSYHMNLQVQSLYFDVLSTGSVLSTEVLIV